MYTSAWPIINQDKETGVSLHAIDDGIDTGDIVAQKTFPVNKHDTARSLYFKYILHGTELIKSQLENLLSGSVLPKPQLADGSSYYARKSIDYQGTLLDLNQVAVSIAAQVRAYNFREYQLPQVQGHSIIDTTILTTRAFAPPGTLLQETENKLVIATIDYDIALIKDNFEVLLSTAKTNDTNKLRASLENTAAAINNTNSHGWTPLIVATYHANHDAFTALLESGADTSCTNINGTTLLMYAKEGYVQTGNDQVLRGCCRMNLDPRMQDYKGLTIFDYCNQNNQSNVLDILREYYD
jgi:methionyl-tRNA formyltransferase